MICHCKMVAGLVHLKLCCDCYAEEPFPQSHIGEQDTVICVAFSPGLCVFDDNCSHVLSFGG